jgi:hypothetical protein
MDNPTRAGCLDHRSGSRALSKSGVLVYESGDDIVNSQLAWYDRTGKQISTMGAPANNYSITLAPDEKRIAIERLEKGSGDIWLIDIARNTSPLFTFDPAWDLTRSGQPMEIRFSSLQSEMGRQTCM